MIITIQSVDLSMYIYFTIMSCITLIIVLVYTHVLIVVLIHVEAMSQNESLLQFVLYVVLLVMINNISITLLNPFLISVNRYLKILT